jgi:hypothetical protein
MYGHEHAMRSRKRLQLPQCRVVKCIADVRLLVAPFCRRSIVLLCVVFASVLSASEPTTRPKPAQDRLKEAYDQIWVGMRKQHALETIGRRIGSSGTEWSAADWIKHEFAEWWGPNFKIRILTRNGQVIKKEFQPLR